MLAFPGLRCLTYDRVSPNAPYGAAHGTLASLENGQARSARTVNGRASACRPREFVATQFSLGAASAGRTQWCAIESRFCAQPNVRETRRIRGARRIVDLFPLALERRCGSISSRHDWNRSAARPGEPRHTGAPAPRSGDHHGARLDRIPCAASAASGAFGGRPKDDALFEYVSQGRRIPEGPGAAVLERRDKLFDYLPAPVVLDRCRRSARTRLDQIAEYTRAQ